MREPRAFSTLVNGAAAVVAAGALLAACLVVTVAIATLIEIQL
jgi:hypothetical protein